MNMIPQRTGPDPCADRIKWQSAGHILVTKSEATNGFCVCSNNVTRPKSNHVESRPKASTEDSLSSLKIWEIDPLASGSAPAAQAGTCF